MTEVLLTVLLKTFFKLGAFSSLAFGFLRSDVLALVVVNVSSDFEVEVCLTGCRCDAVSTGVWFAGSDSAVWCWLMRLQATGGVCCDAEVASKRRADI